MILSHMGSQIGAFYHNRSYWAVKLVDNRWRCELDGVPDFRTGTSRDLDWSLDIVGSGENNRIKELWMFCPKTVHSPLGNTAMLKISERGTAFVLKAGNFSLYGKKPLALIIGQVTDKLTGDCQCFIWDEYLRVMSSPFKTNVKNFSSWRDGVAPIGELSTDVLGLDVRG
jgi:hypothetical protein